MKIELDKRFRSRFDLYAKTESNFPGKAVCSRFSKS